MNIVVLGLGNLLLSDEGVGVRVVEALARRAPPLPDCVTLLDGGTAAMDLLDELCAADHLIVADAINAETPGELITLRDGELGAFFQTKISPHQVGFADVLAAMTLLDGAPQSIVVHGVAPLSLETGMALTPLIAGKVETLCQRIVKEINTLLIDARQAQAESV
ncbi:HyaD/HybD family hydrogenase maturation endopeptidase [Magnetofaba australis]|nr:HyaD/HybD family hydrogenase maturation endopeptidase [Magnetofaba australis]